VVTFTTGGFFGKLSKTPYAIFIFHKNKRIAKKLFKKNHSYKRIVDIKPIYTGCTITIECSVPPLYKREFHAPIIIDEI
jgi:hypothetical protein